MVARPSGVQIPPPPPEPCGTRRCGDPLFLTFWPSPSKRAISLTFSSHFFTMRFALAPAEGPAKVPVDRATLKNAAREHGSGMGNKCRHGDDHRQTQANRRAKTTMRNGINLRRRPLVSAA